MLVRFKRAQFVFVQSYNSLNVSAQIPEELIYSLVLPTSRMCRKYTISKFFCAEASVQVGVSKEKFNNASFSDTYDGDEDLATSS